MNEETEAHGGHGFARRHATDWGQGQSRPHHLALGPGLLCSATALPRTPPQAGCNTLSLPAMPRLQIHLPAKMYLQPQKSIFIGFPNHSPSCKEPQKKSGTWHAGPRHGCTTTPASCCGSRAASRCSCGLFNAPVHVSVPLLVSQCCSVGRVWCSWRQAGYDAP